MKKLFSLLLIIAYAGIVGQVFAQVDTYYYENSKIIFCEEVKNNEPVNASTSFTIPSTGGSVTIQVNNGKALKTDKLIVDIYKKPSGGSDYTEFVETKRYDIETHWDRPYFSYTFSGPGEYKFSVYNADEVWINSATVTMKLKSSSSSSNTNTGSRGGNTRNNTQNDVVDTYYYSDCEVIFCEEVKNNEPVNASTSFTIPKAGGYLTVQVDNGKAMKTNQLIVDIYKKPKGGSDYTEFVETKRYDIETHWNRPYFEYTFYDKGEYKFAIYNADEVWINTGYVTINQR